MSTMMLKGTLVALAAVTGLALPCIAAAQNSPWLVRLRAVNFDSDNKDSTGLGLSVNNKIYPEIDFSYFFTPEIATELALTYPQKHDVRSEGLSIGSVKQMPTTLTVQYHLTQLGAFKPYLGAGISYARFSSVSFDAPIQAALQPTLDKHHTGLALQLGFDYALSKTTYLNFDVKQVQMRTDIRSFGTKVGELKLDPLLVGVGAGWRF